MKIFICSKSEVTAMTSWVGATHVLSLLDPGSRPILHPGTPLQNWLLVHFDDNKHEWQTNSPTEEQVSKILEWGKTLPDDAILLAHCLAGVSRSTAASLALLVQYHGLDKIDECLKMLIDIRPQACPNPIIIRFADKLLGCDGKLIEAVEGYLNSKIISIFGKRY